MSRRGRSGPTISLFSFQDIITSVTAIVTVIALLLALDLVQRKESRAGDSSAALAERLTARLERAEAERKELQRVSAVTDELVQQAAAISATDVKAEIASHQSAINRLQNEQNQLEQQQRTRQSQKNEQLREQFDLAPLKTEQAKLEQQVAELQQQVSQEKSDKRPIYALPKGSRQEGWLAVVGDRQITVAPIGRSAKPIEFAASGALILGKSASQNFAAWIDREHLSGAYFLLLIRPGGSSTLTELEKLFDEKVISHGVDLIATDQPILHPERGADH